MALVSHYLQEFTSPGSEAKFITIYAEDYAVGPYAHPLLVPGAGDAGYIQIDGFATSNPLVVATTTRARASNVATLGFATPHNLRVGMTIRIASVGGTGYNGTKVITAVPTSNTLSYASTASNESTATDTGGLVSRDRHFAWDANHLYPGPGYVNVILACYSKDVDAAQEIPYPLDLRNGQIKLRIRAVDLTIPKNARLVFWFQVTDPDGRTVTTNYAYIGQPLDVALGFGGQGWGRRSTVTTVADSGWRDVVIDMDPDDDASWLAMGVSAARLDGLYGATESVGDSMADFNLDMGILALWQQTDPVDTVPAGNITGYLQISRFEIMKQA